MAGALLCLALCAGTGARGVVGVAAAADDNGGAAAASAAPPAVVDEELPPREERRVDDAEIVQAAQVSALEAVLSALGCVHSHHDVAMAARQLVAGGCVVV